MRGGYWRASRLAIPRRLIPNSARALYGGRVAGDRSKLLFCGIAGRGINAAHIARERRLLDALFPLLDPRSHLVKF